jgi:hypothetical protein
MLSAKSGSDTAPPTKLSSIHFFTSYTEMLTFVKAYSAQPYVSLTAVEFS